MKIKKFTAGFAIAAGLLLVTGCSQADDIMNSTDGKSLACNATKSAIESKGQLNEAQRNSLRYGIKLLDSNSTSPEVKQLVPMMHKLIDGKAATDRHSRKAMMQSVNSICK